MMNNSREQIYGALFDLASKAFPFTKTYRRYIHWDQLKQEMCPLLCMVEPGETYVQDYSGKPPEITLEVLLIAYTWAKPYVTDFNTPAPITFLNPVVDALEKALGPSDVTMWAQTLKIAGTGTVSHCWIEGRIEKSQGDLDGVNRVIIPVKILVPA